MIALPGRVFTILALGGSVFVAYMNIVRTVDSRELRLRAIEKQVGPLASFQNQVLVTLTTIREDIATPKERSMASNEGQPQGARRNSRGHHAEPLSGICH